MFERVGGYYYFYPYLNQARSAIWDGLDKDGMRFIDHFPKYLIKKKNEGEMKIEAVNDSIFRLVGADNFDGKIGTNPVGMVFSEYSLMSPSIWSFFRPILAENGGWAIFNYTPRGENHAYDLYQLAQNDPEWYCDLITADDTNILSRETLERERREIIRLHGDDALFRQEYYCDFTAPIAGAYYAENIQLAYKEGRVGRIIVEPRYPVDTFWDLGVNDTTAIWFIQRVGAEVRIIDFYEQSGQGLPHYAKVLQEKGYVYGEHWAPHDIKVREWGGAGKRRIDTAATLGIDFNVVPDLGINDGIDAARAMFGKCWFEKDKCKDGINALKSYHKQYDEDRKCYLNKPYHDWSSNAADAFRYMALGLDFERSATLPVDKYAKSKKRGSGQYQFSGRPDAC